MREVVFTLPVSFGHEDSVQTDMAKKLVPALGWSSSTSA
jgi:hypothetical protein